MLRYIIIILPVSLCVHNSCKRNSSYMNGPILMKLYTVVGYDLLMCINEQTPSPENIKGDNSKGDKCLCGTGLSFVILLKVLVISCLLSKEVASLIVSLYKSHVNK